MAARGQRPRSGVNRLRFGIQGSGQLVDGSPDPGFFRAVAELAEDLGYDSLWAGDHISFHNPIVDITVALSTFAARTERITIGAGILLLPLRHPSLVAKEFASLDYVSGGRLVLGVGVGGEGRGDFSAVGVLIGERGARADEAMLALRELFRGPPASFAGEFFRFEGISIEPMSTQPGGPPLWVGGRSSAALRRAGRLGDGWMPIWVSPERFERGWEEVRRQAREAGRDPDPLVPAVVLPTRVEDDAAQAEARLADHLSRRYGTKVAPEVVRRYCLAGSPEVCAERVRAYVRAGARHVIFNLGAGPDEFHRQCELLFSGVATGVAS
jgi:probable F420-dependent oxidoreductase